ncbi:MAG TPA: VOC family protein [Gaiellaceae bacterium]|jgi:catechol 2,3-dioxygenase-like lactoylglutathione lyase family enzyme|nr:VOC family protein [Gaiellaceae bacterium]
MERPVERYALGIHHLAQPTMDPRATLAFYVDTMGAKITHCIASKGWRPGHYDYIHMFLDLGKGNDRAYPDNIAMFYYFGAADPSEWPKYGTHHSFGAGSIEELDAWEAWLTSRGHKIVWRSQYEIMTSLYVWDPNGRFLEIAAQHRALNDVDAEDAELTAQALVLAADEKAGSIFTMWEHKARLIEEREGPLAPATLITPRVGEFQPLVAAAEAAGGSSREIGSFLATESDGPLAIEHPADLPEAIWWGAGTGGVRGVIEQFDDETLVITPASAAA